MKVAVLLRGQPRFANEGGYFFQKFVTEKHPNVEFKTFGHAWNTMSKRMLADDNDNDKLTERALPVKLSDEEVRSAVTNWNLTRLQIKPEYDNMRLANEINKTNINRQRLTYDWFNAYANEHSLDLESNNYAMRNIIFPRALNIENKVNIADLLHNDELLDDIQHQIKLDTIRLGYMLGQMMSAGKALAQLQAYIDETGWVPDLVVNTRYDAILRFIELRSIKYMLDSDAVNGENNCILTRRMTSIKSLAIPSDYVFVSNLHVSNKFLSNIRRRLFDTFTNAEIFPRFDLFRTGHYLQHTLWTKIADPDLKFVQPAGSWWDEEVLRPGMFSLRDVKDGSIDEFTALKNKLKKYEYPDTHIHPSNEDIDYIWEIVNARN